MSRSRGATLLTRRSPMRISPAVTSSSPAIMRRMVDLPQPDGPTSTTNSSCATSRSTPRTASTLPNRLVRPFNESCAIPVSGLRDAAGDFLREECLRVAPARAESVDHLALLLDLAAVARKARSERGWRRSALHGAHRNEVLGCHEAPEIRLAKLRGA